MTSFRQDIQGLRALAVGAVLVYHIWPGALSGGYVGVDVFFVISGYLITGLLLRDLRRKDVSLVDFYSRRARRLVPAATVALLCVGLSLPLLPEARWEETAREIAASALYAQNWLLAWLSVDYLGAENIPSPVQHFWSLSIEGQFYLVWPLLMIGTVLVARRARVGLSAAVLVLLSLVVAASLGASVFLTPRHSESAYFVTHTRVWELGLGGILAVMPRLSISNRVAEGMRLLGIGAIAYSSVTFSSQTAFPGYAALLPTLGAALIIVAPPGRPGVSAYGLLACRPARYLGDVSYSVYLWHWPIVAYYAAITGESASLFAGLAIVLATLVVSHFSKIHVEDAFRAGRFRAWTPSRHLGFSGVSIVGCLIPAALVLVNVGAREREMGAEYPERHPGPAALLSDATAEEGIDPIPPLVALRRDMPDVYSRGCHVRPTSDELIPCDYGDPAGDFHVVLVGDSHAANWIPALEAAALERGWRVTSHTKSACAFVESLVRRRGEPYHSCLEWSRRLLAALEESPPSLLVYAHSSRQRRFQEDPDAAPAELEEAVADIWRRLRDLEIHVIAVRDTPWLSEEPSECLAQSSDCREEEERGLRGSDSIVLAHRLEPIVDLLDMTDAFCVDGTCPYVIGNVIVFRDRHHLTATYSRALGPFLGERIDALIESR